MMNNDRRDFIRKAGIGLLAGMGAASGILTGGGFERTTSAAWAVEPGDTGRRWGMLIDTRRCREGCTLCIESCHHTHNVPDVSSPAGTVEWMHKEDGRELLGSACPSTAALPALCNHCAEPSCARACPTDSIFRRTDGIVAIDYHRCVGCRSCMQGCPYGEVSFNWSDPRAALKNPSVDYPTRQRGVVEKCNFCSDRLARVKAFMRGGLAPKEPFRLATSTTRRPKSEGCLKATKLFSGNRNSERGPQFSISFKDPP